VIPINYLQWRRCIEVECGIALKPDFISARVAALTQPGDEPQRFARLYGDEHLQRVIGWFRRAQSEVSTA
jgi:hypothetical protein